MAQRNVFIALHSFSTKMMKFHLEVAPAGRVAICFSNRPIVKGKSTFFVVVSRGHGLVACVENINFLRNSELGDALLKLRDVWDGQY